MEVHRGVTRLCFLIGSKAIKIPNPFNGWHNFVFGILGNLNEKATWTISQLPKEKEGWIMGNSHLLCPVLWQSWGGWISVLERCEPNQEEVDLTPWVEAYLDGDDKPINFGYFQGNLVKLDYGYTAH